MMKNTVTVFVASSFEVHNARVAIGNRIRQLNDKYEVSGIRVTPEEVTAESVEIIGTGYSFAGGNMVVTE